MHASRRLFLRSIAPAGCFAAFFRNLEASAGPPEPLNEAYWRLIQREFPLAEDLVYLNAANVCPASRLVLDCHQQFLRDFHSNPSFQNRDKYERLQERLRAKLAAMLGAEPDEVAILRNTSEANNAIVTGLDLKSGDEVLITDHNHPSNDDAWRVRSHREGFTVRSVHVPVPPTSRAQLLAGFEQAITPRTKVLSVTHVTNTTGILYPVREIATMTRPRGIWLHVDGAQSFGALDFQLRDLGCDSYAASAHKWLMGPLEAGVLFVRRDHIPQLWPPVVSAGWADDLKGARKFEMLGQRDNPRLVAMEAAVDFITVIGMPAVEARMRALADYLKRGLSRVVRVRLKTNLEPELSAGVIKFSLAGIDTAKAYDTLYERDRLGIAMTSSGDAEGLRFCPHVYNSFEQLDRAVSAVRELAS